MLGDRPIWGFRVNDFLKKLGANGDRRFIEEISNFANSKLNGHNCHRAIATLHRASAAIESDIFFRKHYT